MEYLVMERKKSFCLLAGQLPAFSLEYWLLLAINLKITPSPKTNYCFYFSYDVAMYIRAVEGFEHSHVYASEH